MTDELKPCPFCGSNDVTAEAFYAYDYAQSLCNDCLSRGPWEDQVGNLRRPIDAWNTRPVENELRVENQRLLRELEMERKFPERFCMEETIQGQDKTIDRLKAENKRLREALDQIDDITYGDDLTAYELLLKVREYARAASEGESDDQA